VRYLVQGNGRALSSDCKRVREGRISAAGGYCQSVKKCPNWYQLYGQRWNIETDLRSLKRTVHLQQISSRSQEGMEKELLTPICAYNLVRAVMCLAARRAGIATRQLELHASAGRGQLREPHLIATQTKE